MSRADVTLRDVLTYELDHPSCPWCERPTCRAVSCRCSFPRWAAHRLVCGVELGVAG